MEVEVIEADFTSKVLTCRATTRVVDFKGDEQARLVELILGNANSLLEALDRVNDLENPKHVEAAFKFVEEMVIAQCNASPELTRKALAEVQDEILSRCGYGTK